MPRHNKKKQKGKHQVPLAATTAAPPQKTPRVGEDVEFWDSHPVWSFAILDLVWPDGGWTRIGQGDLDDLLACFQQWEKMTWREILAGARKRNHQVDVDKCSPAAQTRLKLIRLDDQEQLMSLAVSAKARLYGILDRATFRLLWWDPEHQVCPNPLKHT